MGRGRQKAKQTKVARALKYYSPQTDYARLQRELQGETGKVSPDSDAYDDYSDDHDDEEDEDYGNWTPRSSSGR